MESDSLYEIYNRSITHGRESEREETILDVHEAFETDHAISEEQYNQLVSLYNALKTCGS